MPTQASAASNHKEEEPTAASSPHVSLLITPLEALCAQPLSLPWLQPLAARLGHSLVSSDGSYVTHFLGPSERNSSSLCCSRLLLQHCGVYLSVCIWSIVESLSVAWWEPCLCMFTQLHGHAHPLFPMGQPKPLREAPPAGGGWRGLCCDHDRPWLWQMAKRSIIGISAAACNCKRSI